MRVKVAFFAALVALAGCTPVEMRGEQGPERLCRDQPAQKFLGKPGDPGAIEGARRASGAKNVRVVRPGEAMTMDYRPERLTVTVDEHRLISRLSCG